MIIPTRCTSCGTKIAHLKQTYDQLLISGKTPSQAFAAIDEPLLGCCKNRIHNSVDILSKLIYTEMVRKPVCSTQARTPQSGLAINTSNQA